MMFLSLPVLEALRDGRLTVVELKNVPVGGVDINDGPQRHLVAVEAFQTGTAIGQAFIFVQLFGTGPNGADLEIPAGYASPISLPTVTRVGAAAAGVGSILIRLYFLKPSTSE